MLKTNSLKTNTVKRVYYITITSEDKCFQTVVTAESECEALRIVAERREGKDRSKLSLPDAEK